MSRLLDAADERGNTPMMIAASHRNGSLCMTLAGLGANLTLKNKEGKTAASITRESKWMELADWLDQKSVSGLSTMKTYKDLQYEKAIRYGAMKMLDLIQAFEKAYLQLVMGRLGLIPIGSLSISRGMIAEQGEEGTRKLSELVDRHQHFIVRRDKNDSEVPDPHPNPNLNPNPNTNPNLNSNSTSNLETIEKNDSEKNIERRKSSTSISNINEFNNVIILDNFLAEMLKLIKSGDVNPNVESLAKPLPWTPLHCAASINNDEMIRLG
jgi:hypothetical protein